MAVASGVFNYRIATFKRRQGGLRCLASMNGHKPIMPNRGIHGRPVRQSRPSYEQRAMSSDALPCRRQTVARNIRIASNASITVIESDGFGSALVSLIDT